ncbi:MAG: hypothetical protein AAGF24_09715 [Cyanobacteria bacterium P01_H01_bin.121]
MSSDCLTGCDRDLAAIFANYSEQERLIQVVEGDNHWLLVLLGGNNRINDARKARETQLNWGRWLALRFKLAQERCISMQGYYYLNYIRGCTIYLGATWKEACLRLPQARQHLRTLQER